jgi:hypothetical protein
METERSGGNRKKCSGIFYRINNMFKNIIAPMQAWLLSQGKCVGCGKQLDKPAGKTNTRITCACGRIYMYDPQAGKHRRATIDEIK